MGTPTPVRNRYLKQSKIMQSIKILIAVLALAGAVYSQEDTVVPEVSSVEETATPVLTSHAKSALIEESSTALSEAHAHLHNDLSHIFKVDQQNPNHVDRPPQDHHQEPSGLRQRHGALGLRQEGSFRRLQRRLQCRSQHLRHC